MSRRIRLCFLVDDYAGKRGMRGEHGLSVLVEIDDGVGACCRLLFDCGQTELFAFNAQRLGESLDDLSAVVISHGHYDHGGGLLHLGGGLQGLDVHLHARSFDERYVTTGGRVEKIGLPFSLEQLERSGASPKLNEGVFVSDGGWMLTGTVPRLEGNDVHLVGLCRGREDRLLDDQALVVPTGEGLLVLTGCAHAGVINILEAAVTIGGDSRVRALVGGFHLHDCDDGKLGRIIERLAAYDIALLAPCHCSGRRAQVDMLRAFPGRVVCPGTGDEIILS